jgi:hypothetical protein
MTKTIDQYSEFDLTPELDSGSNVLRLKSDVADIKTGISLQPNANGVIGLSLYNSDDATNYGWSNISVLPETPDTLLISARAVGTGVKPVKLKTTIPLILSGAPTVDLGAATKKYVDDITGAIIASGGYLLPQATTLVLGGVKQGAGVTITSGVLAANVVSVAGRTGAVSLTSTDVGLSNVDNTSDANKPVSSATQTALNLKANLISPSFTTPSLGAATGSSLNLGSGALIAGTGTFSSTGAGNGVILGAAVGNWGSRIVRNSGNSLIIGAPGTTSGDEVVITNSNGVSLVTVKGNALADVGVFSSTGLAVTGTLSSTGVLSSTNIQVSTNNGMYLAGTNLVGIQTEGLNRATFSSTGLGVVGKVTTPRYDLDNWHLASYNSQELRLGNWEAATEWNEISSYIAGTKRTSITSTGLAITGALSSTGLATFNISGSIGASVEGVKILGPSSDNNWAGGMSLRSYNGTSLNYKIYGSTGGLFISSLDTDLLTLSLAGNLGVGIAPYSGTRIDAIVPTNTTNWCYNARSYDAGTVDGSTTANVLRVVNSGNGNWANAKYHAYSHIWGVGGSASTSTAMTLDSSAQLSISCGTASTDYGSVIKADNGGYGAWLQGSTQAGTHAFVGNFKYNFTTPTSSYSPYGTAGQGIRMTGNEGIIFYSTASGVTGGTFSPSPAMTLNINGNLSIGTTAVSAKVTINNTSQAIDWGLSVKTVEDSAGTSNYYFIDFRKSNDGQTGYIWSSGGTTTSYATSSDYRLKENILPITGALDAVIRLKPSTWTWKVNGQSGQGFIAHELQEICPDAVCGEKDELDKEGLPKYQAVDTSFLVATLTSAIQELTTRLTALEIQCGSNN